VNAVPERATGGLVIIILLPSKTDMGPGVSAAARFNTKKAHLLKIAPWITAILSPAEVETYRLSGAVSHYESQARAAVWRRTQAVPKWRVYLQRSP
jgi:hypothetical protein